MEEEKNENSYQYYTAARGMDYKREMCKLLELPDSFADESSELSEEPAESGGLVQTGCL